MAPTPYRYRLNDHRLNDHHQAKVQSAAKVSIEFLSRNLQGRPLWKRRHSRPLSQALRNGHLKRSLSAFGWTGQRRFRWSSRGILIRIMDKMTAHRKARGASYQQGGFPRRRGLSLQELPPRLRRFKVTNILRSRIFGTGDWEKRGGSTWLSGQGMGISTILGNPLRISSNVLRSCSSSTRGRDCPQPLEYEFKAEFRDG